MERKGLCCFKQARARMQGRERAGTFSQPRRSYACPLGMRRQQGLVRKRYRIRYGQGCVCRLAAIGSGKDRAKLYARTPAQPLQAQCCTSKWPLHYRKMRSSSSGADHGVQDGLEKPWLVGMAVCLALLVRSLEGASAADTPRNRAKLKAGGQIFGRAAPRL
jgi:hypothetical protein